MVEDRRTIRMRMPLTALATVVVTTLLVVGAQTSHAKGIFFPKFDELSAWSPDSRLVATPRKGAIELLSATGSVVRRLRGPGIDYFGWPCECRLGWSADGRQIQFLSQEEEIEGDAVVGSAAVVGGSVQRRSLGVPVGAAAWAPTGWPLIYVPNSRGIRIPSGTRIGPNPDLWRLDSLYAKPRKILSRRGEENDPLFSPDGSEIAFVRETRGATSLWKANADGSNPRRLAAHLLGPSFAAWSPDGQTIALSTFSRLRGDLRCRLYVLSADGGQLRQIVKEEVLTDRPAWMPDGQWIAYTNYRGEIRQVRPDGTGNRAIATLPGREVRGLEWSPDGMHLGYTARPFPSD